jgi:membrane associated rhomboid family serine protease
MKDKSLGIWLIVLFGVSGLMMVSLGWLLPWLESERIVATLGGAAGILVAVTRVLMLRRPNDARRAPVAIEIENKS